MKTLALLAAAASWSAPQTVSAPHTFVGPLYVSADSAGAALAAWDWQDGVGNDAQTGAAQVRTTDATVSPERPAPDGLVGAAAYDGGTVLLANKQLDARGQRWRLTVRDGARKQVLATAFILFRPQLAVASDGSAVVSWVEFHSHRQIVRVSRRRGAGRFSKPVTISGRGQTTVVADAASRNRVLVAFVRGRRLLARVWSPRGGWGPAHQLSRAGGKTHWQLTAATENGNPVLVWIRHRFTSPGHPGVRELFAAGWDGRWSSVQRVERDNAAGVSLAYAPVLALAYKFGPNSAAVARVRYSTGNGHFGPAMDAAPPQGGLRSVSVASAPGAGLVAGWVIPNPSGDGGGIGYAAATGPTGTTFGPREQVTPNEATFDMRLVRTSAGIRAFWTARPEGTGPNIPVSQVHTVVRSAMRSG